jgi:signal transduction histidine kinase
MADRMQIVRSLRLRIAVATAVGLAVALTLVTAVVLLYFVEFGSGIWSNEPGLSPGQRALVRDAERRLVAGEGLVGLEGAEEVAVFDADGLLIASAPVDEVTPEMLERPEWRDARRALADRGSAVHLYSSLVGNAGGFVDERVLIAGSLATVFGIVATVAWGVMGRALRPVEALRREVAAIAGDSLERRVPRPGGNDEIARLADTMNDMLARLEASARRQRRFVADASHELRSPLASARTQVEVALRHLGRADAEAVLRGVLAEHDRLDRLTDDLLRLARLEEGAPRATAPVDLEEIVARETVRLAGVAVDDRRVLAGRVTGDHQQLTSVVRNLLDNAARHARQRVAVSLGPDADRVHLLVDDDGPGVPHADRDRIFERFARLDQARDRSRGGNGLGLAIVRSVVVNHGGTVSVEDAPLGGARFRVTLPAIADTPGSDRDARSPSARS